MNSHLEPQFSKYLANLMTKEEKESFEYELASNSDLKIEFEEYQIGMAVGKRIQYLELKDKVAQLMTEEDSKNGDSKVIKWNIRRLVRTMPAAVIVLILMAIVYIPVTKQSGEAIQSQNTVTPYFGTFRGDSENQIDRARSMYQAGNYDSVLLIIDGMPEIERNQASTQRLLGHTYSAKEDMLSAIAAFQKSIAEPETEDHLEAYWSIGWIYTHSEQYDSTLKYLNKVVDSKRKSHYKKPAKKLLKEVKWQNFIQSWFGWLLN